MEGNMSKNEKKSGTHVDRRRFLKGVAATGAMGVVIAANPVSAGQPEGQSTVPTKSWRDKPDPIDESLISDGGTYDVVVVGGGNAGSICASAAAQKGTSVAVIESQAEKSYTPGAGKEIGHINSQYALSQGAPRIDEDEFLREWARRNVIRHNPKRASYFVKNSGRVFDWIASFADKGWMDENCHIMSCPPKPTVQLEVSGWKFFFGSAIFLNKNDNSGKETWPELQKMHREKAMAKGAKWFFQHHAEICDVDGSGAVTGVIAKTADGKYVRFKARKGVALCAGDFSGNREMVVDILDQLRHEAEAKGDLSLIKAGGGFGGLTRDGTGIKLGIWAGGHIEIGPHSTMGSGDPGTGVWFLQLDGNGERFYDEAAGTAILQPQDHFTVTFFDANWKKILEMMPPRHGAVDTADATSWPPTLAQLDDVKPGPAKYSWKRDRFLRWSLQGDLYCANTIEELLNYADCYKGEARKKASAEISRYNEMCKKGMDEDFGKDRRIMKATELKTPPFYASVNKGGGTGMMMGGGGISAGMVATTGLDTDAEGRVLNSEFKPIKGLYAAGNNAGGRFIVVYQSPLSGISIGMAVTEGCMLGERLAAL
jgi:fumarate reductase flavoprotein subunit